MPDLDTGVDYRQFEMTVDEYAAARVLDSAAEFIAELLAEDKSYPLSQIVQDQMVFDLQF